jgi:hypothetical protein
MLFRSNMTTWLRLVRVKGGSGGSGVEPVAAAKAAAVVSPGDLGAIPRLGCPETGAVEAEVPGRLEGMGVAIVETGTTLGTCGVILVGSLGCLR